MIPLKLLSTLSICLAFGPRQTTQSHLQLVTDHLSHLSNLVSGISLQNSLMNNTINVEETIAEFWKVTRVGDMEQLESFSVAESDFVSTLESITTLFANIGDNPTESGNDIKEGFLRLDDMNQHLVDIEKGVSFNRDTFVSNYVNFGVAKDDIYFLKLEETITIFDYLQTIEQVPFEELENSRDAIRNALNKAHVANIKFQKQFDTLKSDLDLKQSLSKVFALKNYHKKLDPVMTIVTTAIKYNASFHLLRKLSPAISYMKIDATSLPDLSIYHQTFSKLGEILERIKVVVKSLRFTDSAQSEVSIFPDGFRTIDKIFESLKNEWLRSKITGDDGAGMLEKDLEPIKTFGNKMRYVESDWGEYRRLQNILDLTSVFSNALKNMAKYGMSLSQITDVRKSVNSLGGVVQDFQPLPDNLDFDKFHKIYRWVEKLSDLAEKVENVSEILKRNGFNATDVTTYGKITMTLTSWTAKQDEPTPFARDLKNIDGFEDFMRKLGWIVNVTNPNRELFRHAANQPEFSVITPIQKSLVNTNLLTSLKGMTSSTYDSNSVDSLLGFGINSRLICSRKKQLRSFESVIIKIKKLKKSVRAVKEEAENMSSKSGNRVKQSFFMSKAKDLSEWAWELVQGVEGLQKIADLLEKKDIVFSVVNAIDDADVLSSGEMGIIWTGRKKDDVRKMVRKVEHLDRQAKGKVDLKNIAEFLLETSRFIGVPINSELFLNLSIALELSSNPNAQKHVSLFSQFSALDLDFARSKAQIKTMGMAIDPLQVFFDTYFATNEEKSRKQLAEKALLEKERRNFTIIIISIVLALLVLAGISLFVVLKIRSKDPFSDMATYDLMRYTQYNTIEHTPSMSCTKARVCLVSNNLEAFTRLIEEGSYVDACSHSSDKSESMLHEAVRLDRIKFIEVLIKNGADVNFLNHDYETPLQLAQRLKKTDAMTAIEFYSLPELKGSIVKRLPKSLCIKDYAIFTDEVKEHEDLACFARRFEHLCTIDVTRATHIVVKVDADGVYDVVAGSLLLIFNQSILMADGWLKASARNKSTLKNNKNYRVTKLRFKERIFDSVLTIKDFFQRSRIPYLFGTTFSFMEFETKTDWTELKKVCEILGARVVDNQICVPKLTPDEPLHDAVTRFAKNPALRSLYYTVNRTRLIMVHLEEDSFLVGQHPTYGQLVLGFPPAYCPITEDEIVIFLLTWEIVHPKLEKMKDKFKPLNNIKPKRRGDQ